MLIKLKQLKHLLVENRSTDKNAVCVCIPAGISLSSSVQRCTNSPNMPRPRAVLCSCKTDRTSSSPDKQRQESETELPQLSL